MISIPLGKITVTTHGTPVAITLTDAQKGKLPPSGLALIEARVDAADTGTVYVQEGTTKLACLPKAEGGHAEKWESPGPVNPLSYSVNSAVDAEGPLVTLWVE